MVTEHIDVLVIGAGQAGIAMSEHLGRNGISYLVLERNRIAERWRSCRWDSLVANGPAWHDRFPGMEFSGHGPDSFVPKEEVADYLKAYAEKIGANIRCGVTVRHVQRNQGRPGFKVETSNGLFDAEYVVVATGAFQNPVIPTLVPETEGLTQLHSNAYRNPAQLPEGAVLVVGSGSSGVQIADELLRAGRRVYLSVGPHDRPPRRYRGRDFCWWLGVLNKWDAEAPPTTDHVTIAVSGANGGETIDFRRLAAQGMTLLGRTEACQDGMLSFASDLASNLAKGDRNYLSLLEEADAYVVRNGLDLPEEPEAKIIPPDPECVTTPIRALNLKEAGISTIIWATGFVSDYNWLKLDCFNENGTPKHQRGVSAEPGLYFLGLPWQSRRGSSFIWGVWHDAKFIADHIIKQRGYLAYQGMALPEMAD
ncbi:flavin-containing monooxygenase [Acidocella aminolytica]|jgi:putative flavoprotein involved in K+ transport|uniref:Flavin-containing monooxygenase n=1 Tax=Acidocella aminolytica 101 = DSM 11237 TaxID=1120923 RepID=A0A0D6PFX3_9PROT|nr:NAD(P)/FAD-dependent oxidoreductase [Acidocella aminolytica]GAN80630.1 flavin-containing monooxygenase [Acidocella aminolytica 101 = DSM 11237]GBQ40190.1 flavin-containing monooxygenase [Acidocella aminolytica 101 = DSM 11237]SHE55634.1 putative flavoprotein involved in K+ transport [Acidocella aminolytica 101 = DSM 11237]